MTSADTSQITCRFTTKLPAEYKIPRTEIAVPGNLTRYGLSQAVNHLLDLEENVPLDFLVSGELVRLPLGVFLLKQGISAESVLEIEYILAVTPPNLEKQVPHDDWVGAIDGSNSSHILSGCYDGYLRVWNGDGEKLGEAQAHTGPISQLAYLKDQQRPTLLSAGKLDHTIRLLQIPRDPAQLNSHGVTCSAVYRGHQGSPLAIAAAPGHDHFVSASQDKTLRIWPLGEEAAQRHAVADDIQGSKKKRKTQNGNGLASQASEVGQSLELTGHSDAATSVLWPDTNFILSGSMDHSVRRWDAETGTAVETYNGGKAVFCLGVSALNPHSVAFAGAAKTLRIWDHRQKHSASAGGKIYTSHTSYIKAIAWKPASEYHLATASMDKTLKLWDTRSSIPLHTLKGHSQQVLCVAWWNGNKIVSGSADNTICIYNSDL